MPVSHFLNTTAGAPSLSGQAGALIALLDAALINGFTGHTPPAGWSKVYSGTNKAVYRSTALGSSGMYLRVDDSNATYAIVDGYEAMTDVDTGTNKWNTAAVYWQKSYSADATVRKYVLACDERFFWLGMAWYPWEPDRPHLSAFGDFVSDIAGDGYACLLHGYASAGTYDMESYKQIGFGATQPGLHLARSYSGAAGGVAGGKMGFSGNYFGQYGFPSYPNQANGDKYAIPIRLVETTAFRGVLPGLYNPLHATHPAAWSTFTGVAGAADRTFMSVGDLSYYVWLDLTGPWR